MLGARPEDVRADGPPWHIVDPETGIEFRLVRTSTSLLYVSRHEVTRSQYDAGVAARSGALRGRTHDPDDDVRIATDVSLHAALRFAAEFGYRLLKLSEWCEMTGCSTVPGISRSRIGRGSVKFIAARTIKEAGDDGGGIWGLRDAADEWVLPDVFDHSMAVGFEGPVGVAAGGLAGALDGGDPCAFVSPIPAALSSSNVGFRVAFEPDAVMDEIDERTMPSAVVESRPVVQAKVNSAWIKRATTTLSSSDLKELRECVAADGLAAPVFDYAPIGVRFSYLPPVRPPSRRTDEDRQRHGRRGVWMSDYVDALSLKVFVTGRLQSPMFARRTGVAVELVAESLLAHGMRPSTGSEIARAIEWCNATRRAGGAETTLSEPGAVGESSPWGFDFALKESLIAESRGDSPLIAGSAPWLGGGEVPLRRMLVATPAKDSCDATIRHGGWICRGESTGDSGVRLVVESLAVAK